MLGISFSSIVRYIESRSFLFLGLFLMVLGLVTIGIPYYNIGWVHDDIGVLYNIKIESLADVKRIFTANLRDWVLTDLESVGVKYTAFSVWYRPLGMLFMGLQHFLFGAWAYGYFLVNVLLHSLNSVLFMYILRWSFRSYYSFLGALFFLFHGSVMDWLHIICAVQDILHVTCILLIIVFYRKFLLSGGYRWYFLSALIFFAGLFVREVIIVFPGCMFLYLVLIQLWGYKINFKYIFKLFNELCLFAGAIFVYIAIRIGLFGIGNPNVSLDLSLKDRLWSYIASTTHVLGLTFLKNPNPRMRILFLFPIIILLVYLACKNTKKRELFVLMGSGILLGWPFLLLAHWSRYVYPCVPIVIALILYSVLYARISFVETYRTRILTALFLPLSLWGGVDSWIMLSMKAEISFHSQKALVDLNPLLRDKSLPEDLVFVGLPYHMYATALEQGVRCFSGCLDKNIYNVKSTRFYHVFDRKRPYNIDIQKIKSGYRLVSNDESVAYWTSVPEIKEGGVYDSGFGTLKINKKYGKWKATDISIIFDFHQYPFLKRAAFFGWDSRRQRFKII